MPLSSKNQLRLFTTTQIRKLVRGVGLAHKFTSANYPIPGEVFDTYGDAVADKVAAFTMPAAYYDVYIAKGKPGGCLDLEAYTYTTVEGVVTLLFIGSIEIDRATGKPKWQNINFLLYGPNGEIFFADP